MSIVLPPTIPASQARSNFYQMIDEAADDFKQFTITHRGKVKAVVMSAEELESWQETLDIMSNKKLMRNIKKGRAELKAGQGISEDEANKILGW